MHEGDRGWADMKAIEHATAMRAGRTYWRSRYGHRYGLELGDLGRGRPSFAVVFGFWQRFELRRPAAAICRSGFQYQLN